ncbi:hypothetical protein SDC9_86957 [bioreactor metagenome]|uniref:Uncharacterized protein n=1 Tax=bioreactor metagenome TaxID=1076179 RepID=A0A644ZHW6_9ZZZZ
MDYTLPVDDHRYFFDRHLIQRHGLDAFQPLVHQGSRVDGHLGSHAPVWMLQRLLRRDPGQALPAPAEKRAAGGGEYQPPDLSPVPTALQTLKNCRMLGIHRQNFPAAPPDSFGYQRPGADQGLLVGQGNALAGVGGGQGGG